MYTLFKKRRIKLPLTNRCTSMIENTSTHNLHSSLVLNGSIWWCCVMILLCSLYWRKMKQKVKSFPEYRSTVVMVQGKKLNLSKRTLNKLFFDIQIRIRKPIYYCNAMRCNIIIPYNAIIRYNYIYRKIEYLFCGRQLRLDPYVFLRYLQTHDLINIRYFRQKLHFATFQ